MSVVLGGTRRVPIYKNDRQPWPHGGACRAAQVGPGLFFPEPKRCRAGASTSIRTLEKERVQLCAGHADDAERAGEVTVITERG